MNKETISTLTHGGASAALNGCEGLLPEQDDNVNKGLGIRMVSAVLLHSGRDVNAFAGRGRSGTITLNLY